MQATKIKENKFENNKPIILKAIHFFIRILPYKHHKQDARAILFMRKKLRIRLKIFVGQMGWVINTLRTPS